MLKKKYEWAERKNEEERHKYEREERKRQALSRLDEIAAQTRKLQKLDLLLDQSYESNINSNNPFIKHGKLNSNPQEKKSGFLPNFSHLSSDLLSQINFTNREETSFSENNYLPTEK